MSASSKQHLSFFRFAIYLLKSSCLDHLILFSYIADRSFKFVFRPNVIGKGFGKLDNNISLYYYIIYFNKKQNITIYEISRYKSKK